MEEITYLIPCTASTIIILILIGIAIWAIADKLDQDDKYNNLCDELDTNKVTQKDDIS